MFFLRHEKRRAFKRHESVRKKSHRALASALAFAPCVRTTSGFHVDVISAQTLVEYVVKVVNGRFSDIYLTFDTLNGLVCDPARSRRPLISFPRGTGSTVRRL